MGRQAFITDLNSAIKNRIDGVCNIERGSEDGELHFTYTTPSGQPLQIHALITDISEYPASPIFLYTESQQAPQEVHEILDRLNNRSRTYSIHDLICQTVMELEKGFNIEDQENSDGDENGEDIDFLSDNDEDEAFWSPSFVSKSTGPVSDRHGHPLTKEFTSKIKHQIAEDLRTVHLAGFKVGVVSGMKPDSSSSLLSISIHVQKLGLSDEALEMWGLEGQQYVVLLMKYNGRYTDLDTIIKRPAHFHEIEFRFGASDTYKPEPKQAYTAFSSTSGISIVDQSPTSDVLSNDETINGRFQSTFVSTSLNDFMNGEFMSLLKTRIDLQVDWDTAKSVFNDLQGKISSGDPVIDSKLLVTCPPSPKKNLPEFLNTDHLIDCDEERRSLPLLAMQFAMRYFIRCTEYCLVCHETTTDTFEALRPYVCSKPLCLYQYMSLGFGPSVEHEILTQPDVVDLLVSFCYASAKAQKLRQYPVGMNLLVPLLGLDASLANPAWPAFGDNSQQQRPQTPINGDKLKAVSYNVRLDELQSEILFDTADARPLTLRPRDWVVITVDGKQPKHHQVIRVTFPTVSLAKDGVTPISSCSETPNLTPPSKSTSIARSTSFVAAKMIIYDTNFDDLNEIEKSNAIVMILEALPSVKDMTSYLTRRGQSSEPSLKGWGERISPAAMGLLRWIIASNLSCIMQVENTKAVHGSKDLKVTQMEDWVQFRFAQGAPDKEQRFHKALLDNKEKLNLKYPTLFAWHGSALPNWHSIIRTGLDFKDTVNGRAYGHGCYHSQDYNTSAGYSGGGAHYAWPNSELRVTSAMCLNEIVNLPEDFVSSNPHLVVQHLDWIQCRYLFVKSGKYVDPVKPPAQVDIQSQNEADFMDQDPKHTVRGPMGKRIGIPKCAVSASKVLSIQNKVEQHPTRKRQKTSSPKEIMVTIDDEDSSEMEDPEDLAFLWSDSDVEESAGGKPETDRSQFSNRTDFVAGKLDWETLPLLAPPSYATSTATNALTRELKTILKIQENTPGHELGWYIDGNRTDNIYQWIVELHSFESDLPLAQDMKKVGVHSVVLEVRFGKDYPMSPPFVRVIRPRFLPFMSGGGGHVTSGGALCMELLTNSGWTAVSSIEGVLLQVRMAISSVDPKPARLESLQRQNQRDYGIGEAMDAYIRACTAHGWEIPKDFKELSYGGSFAG